MKFFKVNEATPEQIKNSLEAGWNIGFTGEEKPSELLLRKIKEIPFAIYFVRNNPNNGKIIGWNLVKACSCFGREHYLEEKRKRFEGVEIYNFESPCQIHKK